MIYPKASDDQEKWLQWLNEVAPYQSLCSVDLHPELRYLSSIPDREIAALGARGAVATLRKRGEIKT